MYNAECMIDVCVKLTDMINVVARLYLFGLNGMHVNMFVVRCVRTGMRTDNRTA